MAQTVNMKTWRYINTELKKLQQEVDDALQRDGDQLKHARITDYLQAVRRIIATAQRIT